MRPLWNDKKNDFNPLLKSRHPPRLCNRGYNPMSTRPPVCGVQRCIGALPLTYPTLSPTPTRSPPDALSPADAAYGAPDGPPRAGFPDKNPPHSALMPEPLARLGFLCVRSQHVDQPLRSAPGVARHLAPSGCAIQVRQSHHLITALHVRNRSFARHSKGVCEGWQKRRRFCNASGVRACVTYDRVSDTFY